MHTKSLLLSGLLTAAAGATPCKPKYKPIESIQLGPRPYWLVDDMKEGPLKEKLQSCSSIKEFKPSAWNIGHRGGGTLFIPEHSLESNLAGARMGSGILECDVAFTKDRELVCRHAQCDLHYTTDVVTHPDLNAKCTKPFEPATSSSSASANCCTSDFTLSEIKSLCARMEGANPQAKTPEEYLLGSPDWRTEIHGTCATILSHREHILLVDQLGLDFTPELKEPEVEMPFQGEYTQEDYAQQMVDDYRDLGIDPSRVFVQSFVYGDVLYWISKEPEFGKQAVFLDSYGETPETFPGAVANLSNYAADGVRIVAPPLPYLVKSENGSIVPSSYADEANRLGLDIIAWSLERSGRLSDGLGGGYYFESISDLIERDGDVYELLDVLARQVGIKGIFTDWSATVTYYANCFGFF